jgi:hypothetical protein
MNAILVGFSLALTLALTSGVVALRHLERSVRALKVEAAEFSHPREA